MLFGRYRGHRGGGEPGGAQDFVRVGAGPGRGVSVRILGCESPRRAGKTGRSPRLGSPRVRSGTHACFARAIGAAARGPASGGRFSSELDVFGSRAAAKPTASPL